MGQVGSESIPGSCHALVTLVVYTSSMNTSTRRDFLVTAGSLTLGSAALSMIGCGGLFAGADGGGAGGSLTKRQFNGELNLPAGTDLTKLKVTGPLGITPLVGNKFSVTGFEQFPVMVTVIEPVTGKTILLGVLDPDSSVHVLDASNCAATLLFVALGGSQLFGAERQAFWTDVQALGALPALVTVVNDRITADLYALENQDAQIIAALDTAAHAGSPPLAVHQAKQNQSKAISKGREPSDLSIVLVKPGPGGALNGISVTNANHQGVKLYCHRRRETHIHMYVSSGLNAAGQIHASVENDVIPPFRLPSRTDSDLITVGLYQDDVGTAYDVMCLTPLFDSYPAHIFDDGVYEGEKAVWRADLAKMYKRAEVGLVCKILLEAVGMSGVSLDSGILDSVASNLTGLGGNVASLVLAAADGTDLSGGVKSFAQEARSSDTVALDFLQAIAPLVQSSNPVLYYDLSRRNYGSEQLIAFRAALRLIAYTGAMNLSLELGPEYKDLTGGENSDGSPEVNGGRCIFNIFKRDVRMTPNGGEYSPGTNIPFTITVDGHEGPFTYDWRLSTVSAATLDDGHGKVGFEFRTDQKTVTLKTNAGSVGDAYVSAEVFSGPPEALVSIGVVQTVLVRRGTTGLFVDVFETANSTWVIGMAVFEKPKTPEGGNHYKGGRIIVDVVYDDLSNPGNSGSSHYEFTFPPFTGLPGDSVAPPHFAGTKIQPSAGGIGTGQSGIDAYELGNRIVLIRTKGQYFPSSSQSDIDFVINTVNKTVADSRVSVVFVPSS